MSAMLKAHVALAEWTSAKKTEMRHGNVTRRSRRHRIDEAAAGGVGQLQPSPLCARRTPAHRHAPPATGRYTPGRFVANFGSGGGSDNAAFAKRLSRVFGRQVIINNSSRVV